MGLKVADLTVDVHAGLDTFRSELESGLQDTEAIELPIDVAVDKVQGVEGDGGPTEVAEEAADGGAEDLLGHLGGGAGGGGAVTAIATTLGISATAATGILIAVGAILAVVGVISIIGMKALQMGIQNSQIVASINSFLNDTLGALFDMLIIVIFASIVGQLLPHVDALKDFWEGELQPLFADILARGEEMLPPLLSLSEAFLGAVGSFIEPLWSLINGIIWPLIETYLSYAMNVLFPILEVGFGFIEHVLGPLFQAQVDFWVTVLQPVFEGIQDVLDDLIGPFMRTLVGVFEDDIWPFLDEYLMPTIDLIYEIFALIIAPILDIILQLLYNFLEPIFDVLAAVIGPAIEAIIWVLEPIFEHFVIPILTDIKEALEFANEILAPDEWRENIKEGTKSYWEDISHMERREGETVSEKYQPSSGGPKRAEGEDKGWYPGKYAKDTWDGVSGGWW